METDESRAGLLTSAVRSRCGSVTLGSLEPIWVLSGRGGRAGALFRQSARLEYWRNSPRLTQGSSPSLKRRNPICSDGSAFIGNYGYLFAAELRAPVLLQVAQNVKHQNHAGEFSRQANAHPIRPSTVQLLLTAVENERCPVCR
jgi:hypothetical protein